MLYRDWSEDCLKETKEREDEKQIEATVKRNGEVIKDVDFDPKGQPAEI